MKRIVFCLITFLICMPVFNQEPYTIRSENVRISKNGIINSFRGNEWDWTYESIIIPDSLDNKKIIGLFSLVPGGAESKVKHVILPKDLRILGPYTFSNNSLESITLPKNLTYLGESTFNNNPLTGEILLPEPTKPNHVFIGWNDTIKSGTPIQTCCIDYNACFKYLGSGSYVLSSEDVYYDNNYIVICYYHGSKNITIPDYLHNEKITGLSKDSFRDLNLEKITFPNSIKIIREWAFRTNSLDSIIFPENLEEIGKFAFSHNELKYIVIPNKITTIEKGVFSDNQLRELIIPENIISIKERAFENNILEKISLPASLTFIGKNAFSGNNFSRKNIPKLPLPQAEGKTFLHWQGSDKNIYQAGDRILDDVAYTAVFE